MSKKLLIASLVLGLLVLVSGSSEAESNTRNVCFRDCASCRVRCRNAADSASCEHTCLEIKRLCCRSGGAQPGPQMTCNCG